MKRILITGANSYIGTSFGRYMKEKHAGAYEIETLDMRDEGWKKHSFSGYDAIFHVAGIAHQKETKENVQLYYQVNRDLAIETARKVKEEGVEQFIFMSSMSVYGLDHSKEMITLDTECKPKTNYGKSKLEAEKEILKMADSKFKIAVLRPPMVYGKDCPGNLTKLYNAVRKFHVFPTIRNERSSISIEMLCESIEEVLKESCTRIYLPQNEEYMCTYEMVREQMKEEKVKVVYVSIFNPIIRMMIGKVGVITKAFGDLRYEK